LTINPGVERMAASVQARYPMAEKKPKATLYVEIDAGLKARIDRMAEANGRKLVAEGSRALEFYLAAHEARPEKPSKGGKA
jgi:hypothetical protein